MSSQGGQRETVDEILGLEPGAHLCLFYDRDPREQLECLLPYVCQGLEGGEQVIYVADDLPVPALRAGLADRGVDVESVVRNGSLRILDREEWRQADSLDSASKSQQVEGMIESAISSGYCGVRFGIEMTWTLGPEIDADSLLEWELLLNEIIHPGKPCRMICQYSRARLKPDALMAAIAAHPLAALSGQVFPNPHYRPTAASSENAAQSVDRALVQMRWVRRYEEERQQRLHAERQLQEAQETQRRIEQLYNLSQANVDALASANAIKDEFLDLVSHELQTPLTVILGNAETLLTSTEVPRQRLDAALLDVKSEAERLQGLVENLLLLTKRATGDASDFEAVSLGTIVRRVVERHQQTHPHRRFELTLDDHDGVLANSLLLERVLDNVLVNACKYSAETESVELRSRREGDYCLVEVADRGCGVPPEDAERVFEPFYRSSNASELAHGLGLGLSVSRRIIEAHGGRMWVTNRDGGGSIFCFSVSAALLQ